MIRMKSFEENRPTLFLVPTPIGNRNEMTPRAIEVLKAVDVIACEDTRTSGQLLKYYGIHNRLIAYQKHNEESSSNGIIKLLEQGNNIALISDAGYPLMNDPGQVLVSKVVELGYPVVPLSGCNAMLNGLVASGLVVQPFVFVGFLPANQNDSAKLLEKYVDYPETLVFYEAPHRLEKFLQTLLKVFGNRRICIARELTKLHEEFLRGTIEEMIPIADELKGEMVVVLEGSKKENQVEIQDEDVLQLVQDYLDQGYSKKDAINLVTKETGLKKNDVKNLVFQQEK